MRRLSMKKIKAILRLKFITNISYRQISRALNVPSSTVGDYCKRFEIIDKKIDELYGKIKVNDIINNLLKKLANIYLSEDPIMGLYLLFTYDILYIAHPFICEYLDNGKISDENYNKLNNLLI